MPEVPKLTKDEAYKLLRIIPPFTEQELISAFRKATLTHHPDKGGDTETIVKVYEAREILLSDCQGEIDVTSIDGKKYASYTVDGRRLSELGKGLKVSARKCYDCGGKGYTSQSTTLVVCDCLKPESRRGVSFWQWFNWKMNHKPCNGTGYVESKIGQKHYVCRDCEGTGEIANFNGFFGRGMMIQDGNKSQKERKGR